MLGGSFRWVAKALVPLVLLFILAACGSSKQKTSEPSIGVRCCGFAFDAPLGWAVAVTASSASARHGSAVVSVTRFPLREPYDQSQFDRAATTLDAVAARLAKTAGAGIDKAETVIVAHRKARAYTYGAKRIGFVLAGRDEYQLFCAEAAGSACDLLFATFRLTGPQA
jgi:hypothetical protein